jgi:hypothetical protein
MWEGRTTGALFTEIEESERKEAITIDAEQNMMK